MKSKSTNMMIYEWEDGECWNKSNRTILIIIYWMTSRSCNSHINHCFNWTGRLPRSLFSCTYCRIALDPVHTFIYLYLAQTDTCVQMNQSHVTLTGGHEIVMCEWDVEFICWFVESIKIFLKNHPEIIHSTLNSTGKHMRLFCELGFLWG